MCLVLLAVCVAVHAVSVEAEVEAEIEAEFQQGVCTRADLFVVSILVCSWFISSLRFVFVL